MAQLERADLHGEIEQRFPDNTTEEITPLAVRDFMHNLVDSALLVASDNLELSKWVTLAQARAQLTLSPPTLQAGQLYAIAGAWNAAGNSTVYVPAISNRAFHVQGVLFAGGIYALVSVDVVAGTAVAVATYQPIPQDKWGLNDPPQTLATVNEALDYLHGRAATAPVLTTPAKPNWTYLSATRTLSLAHGTLAASELEYTHDGGFTWLQYTGSLPIDGAAHAYGDYIGRVKATTGREVSAIANSPAIAAAAVSATKLTAPTGPAFTPTSTTTAGVSWNPVSGNNGYTVQYATDAAFTLNVSVVAAAAGATSLVLGGLTTDLTYYARILTKGNGTTTLDSEYGPVVNAKPSGLKDLVLCLGDSLTKGADDPANAYPVKLQDLLGAGVEVLNLGVNGQPISKALQSPSVLGSLAAQIAAIDRSKYRRIVAVVDGGVNDARLLAQNYPGQDAVALTFAARKAAHQTLVVAGIPTISLSHTNYDYPASGGQISPALNTAIRATAQEEDKYIRAYWSSELLARGFVDFATTKLGWQNPDPTYFVEDGVHYAPIGSLERANRILTAVLAVLAGNTYGMVTPLAFNNTVVLQDTSSAITYGPDWFFADASGGTPDAFVYSGGTAHVAQNAGTPLYADVVIPIDCAELEYWLIDFIHPISVDLSVGGGPVTTIRVAAVAANTNSVNKRTLAGPFTAGQLLHVASTPMAGDAHVVLDKIAFNRQAVPPPTTSGHVYATAGSVEESSLSCEYEGTSWNPASGFPAEYGTDGVARNNTSGTDPMTFYFKGTQAEYWSFSHPGSSDFFVSIDGGAAVAITGVATQVTSASKVLYTTPTLAAGNHSLRLTPKGSGMLTVARFVVS